MFVSICPDDSDNDGIIDNIDLDLDNDGILNSVESNGEIKFDFSDTNSPILENNGNTLSISFDANSNSFNSGATTNTLSGTSDGNFETKVPSNIVIGAKPANSRESSSKASSSFISYKLENFSENLNLNFTGQQEIHTTVSGEYFEISVFPTSKNITLLDPKNHLLINKPGEDNYTEIETLNGLKQYSSNTIRFKFNPDETQYLNLNL